VTPITTATNTAGRPIPVSDPPVFIAITPDGKTVYVAGDEPSHGTTKVTPIQTATNTAGPPIAAGSFPTALAITPEGKTAYLVSTTIMGSQEQEQIWLCGKAPHGAGALPGDPGRLRVRLLDVRHADV
jgi:DNA-binding beta-propeller fold protein YncE